jgi:hypothetical protein
MAIFGVGAFFNGKTDVSADFLRAGVACVGWSRQDAPALYKLLERIHAGDIVYIKAHPPGRKLIVKAIGIVTDAEVKSYRRLGHAVCVRWIWRDKKRFIEKKGAERYNVRNNTLYEEMSPVVQKFVLDLLLTRIHDLEEADRSRPK